MAEEPEEICRFLIGLPIVSGVFQVGAKRRGTASFISDLFCQQQCSRVGWNEVNTTSQKDWLYERTSPWTAEVALEGGW